VSEEVNRKLCANNTTVQLLVLYTDPERHITRRYRRTDRQTTSWCQWPIVLCISTIG